jgi:hypothetical protein
MPSRFDIDLGDFNHIYERLHDLLTLCDAEISDGCNQIAAEAKDRAPANDGILRNEIGTNQLSIANYEVFSNAYYSAYVEFGTRTLVAIPPGLEEYAGQFQGPSSSTSSVSAKDAIEAWCKAKGIDEDEWEGIYIFIMVKGIHPHPFFFPAVNRILPIIVNRVLRALVSSAFL